MNSQLWTWKILTTFYHILNHTFPGYGTTVGFNHRSKNTFTPSWPLNYDQIGIRTNKCANSADHVIMWSLLTQNTWYCIVMTTSLSRKIQIVIIKIQFNSLDMRPIRNDGSLLVTFYFWTCYICHITFLHFKLISVTWSISKLWYFEPPFFVV